MQSIPDTPDTRTHGEVRPDRYAPLTSYAAIGDGRTLALVARDGSIDWLALPDLDSPSVFGALLDPDRGGQFTLAPLEEHTVDRRYLPRTNVLETTFTTADGQVRVTDALTVESTGLAPGRELVRRIDGIRGRVPMRWSVRPRFGYGLGRTRLDLRGRLPVARAGADAVAVCAFDAGQPAVVDGSATARFVARAGTSGLIALATAHQEPLVLPGRAEIEARLEHTCRAWRTWAGRRIFQGSHPAAVARSALAIRLLVHAPTGALAAAGTTSLPEEIGGERNWDYRYSWIRDSALTLSAFLRLGCLPEARAYFWWLMQASQLTHPRLRVLYRLDGGARTPERHLALAGYRGSRPVRVGNGAADQLQLDTYGELLQAAWRFATAAEHIDRDIGARLADTADLVCRVWRRPDQGIWEVRSEPRHFTQSKMMCWVALDRACRLADIGAVPAEHAPGWRQEADTIRDFVEEHCVDAATASYVRFPGSSELDASVLLGLLHGFGDARSTRWVATVDAIGSGLRDGPYVRRYTGEDGLSGAEGAFVACSFWLAEAYARIGRVEAAERLFGEMLRRGNDVGLYAEEIDPVTGAHLGNLPQALSHLALISAALAITDANGGGKEGSR